MKETTQLDTSEFHVEDITEHCVGDELERLATLTAKLAERDDDALDTAVHFICEAIGLRAGIEPGVSFAMYDHAEKRVLKLTPRAQPPA